LNVWKRWTSQPGSDVIVDATRSRVAARYNAVLNGEEVRKDVSTRCRWVIESTYCVLTG
jgi:hypothetical protein